MGRVSKYKKVKSVSLFAGDASVPTGAVWGFTDNGRKQKKRSATAQSMRKRKLKRKRETDVLQDDGFDLPPQGEDDFNLSDFAVRRQKPMPLEEGLVDNIRKAASASGVRCVIPETQDETLREARLLKIGPKTKKEPASTPRGRMEGESKNAFSRRVKNETRQIIKREAKDCQNPAKRQKKKDFLNNKKKKKKGDIKRDEESDIGGSAEVCGFEDNFITGERAAASRVVFGEQVERPPVFQQLPRGAKMSVTRKMNKKSSATSMSDSQIEAEHNAMDAMRRKVQAQYKLIKQKRKRAGEFHL